MFSKKSTFGFFGSKGGGEGEEEKGKSHFLSNIRYFINIFIIYLDGQILMYI